MQGKNGHAYRSIGKVLIDRGEVKKEDMSMQAIRHWGETHSEARFASCWNRTRLSFSLNRNLLHR